jgi:hypothetical protein
LAKQLSQHGQFDVRILDDSNASINCDLAIHTHLLEDDRGVSLWYRIERKGHPQTGPLIFSGQRHPREIYYLCELLVDHAFAEILDPSPGRSKRTEPLVPHEAFLLCDQGLNQLGLGTRSGILQAFEFFEKAARIAPQYGAPWAGLARCYLVHTWYHFGVSGRTCLQRSR